MINAEKKIAKSASYEIAIIANSAKSVDWDLVKVTNGLRGQ
jgi:hypothetical protein